MPRQDRKTKLDFYKLAVAHSDIGQALAGFQQIIEHDLKHSDPLFMTLSYGSIVCYAKPFVGNKIYGRLPSRWERFPDERLRNAHNGLLELRHTIVAHNDSRDVKVILVPPGSRIVIERHDAIEVDDMFFGVQYPAVHESAIPDYIAVCQFLEFEMLEVLRVTKDILFDPNSLPKGPFVLEF